MAHSSQTAASATALHVESQSSSPVNLQQHEVTSSSSDRKDRVCSFPSSTDLDYGTAWNALVCNEGVNLVNWWAQGTGNDMYWPPNQERNATLNNQVPGSLAYCKYLSAMGLYGVPEKTDDYAFWLDTAYGENILYIIS